MDHRTVERDSRTRVEFSWEGNNERDLRPTRPSDVWPCAGDDLREGTGVLANWLLTAVVKIVTAYSRPGQRVLLLDPAPYLAPPASRPGTMVRNRPRPGPYAGLHEASWTVARLGRGVQTQTAVAHTDPAGEHSGDAPAESDSGPRLPTAGPTTDQPTGPPSHHHPEPDPAGTAGGPDRYDLVITAAEPRTLDWLRPADWAGLLTPNGTLAVITHGDHSRGRFTDPTGPLVRTAHHDGLRYLDRIALLRIPIRGGALAVATPATHPSSQAPVRPLATPVRHTQVHDDLMVFTRQPAPNNTAEDEEPSDRPASSWPLPLPPGEQPSTPPLSVWPTGQRDPAAQLRDAGCVPGTETDTERIPPAVAAHAIATYTRPGDLVLDPDCGAGTVLVEALRAGRHALGLTARTRWWALARANVTAAKTAGAWRDGTVLDDGPKVLATIRAAGLVGRVGLVLTILRTAPDDPKFHETGPDRDPVEAAIAELAATFLCCEPLLRSGGHLVVVARPLRHPDGTLVDLTTPLLAAGTSAGLAPVQRCIALTAGLRGSRLVPRASLAERRAAARARAAGVPTALTAHHEVFVFQLAHDAELAASAAAGIPWPTEDESVRPAVNGAKYPGWRPAA